MASFLRKKSQKLGRAGSQDFQHGFVNGLFVPEIMEKTGL